MRPGSPWRPVLAGELAARAGQILGDLEAALETDRSCAGDPTLSGEAGRALFWGYLDATRRGSGYGDRAAQALDRAIDLLASQRLTPALYHGFLGTAWVAEHLCDPADENDANEQTDAVLHELVETSPWTLDFDLISGLAGFGVYALERVHQPLARACLARIVGRIAELARPRRCGLSWLSRPELLAAHTAAEFPKGCYTYGVAHGVPALAVVLAGACAAGIETTRARALLDGAMSWLWAGRLPEGSISSFPYREEDENGGNPSRLAWCYGDLGVAVALHAAARAVDHSSWAGDAVGVALRSTIRDGAGTGVQDAGLCHGSSGLALLYARLWNATDDPLFAAAAQRWFAHTLALHAPGEGVGGYRALWEDQWRDDASFLTGSTGIALALLAGIGAVEPAWDRLLAASLPPAGARR